MNAQMVPSINALFPSVNGGAFMYYNHVIKAVHAPKNIGVILVAHSYETVFALASSVAHLGNLRGVILKNSTHTQFPEVGEKLINSGIPVLGVTKSEVIGDMGKVVEQINAAIPDGERFVIMDHGGYFAFSPELFEQFPANRLIGVAEHTLNGEKRYEALNIIDRPIISIGRSHIKKPSDEAAADAIIHASDTYLQTGGLSLDSQMLRVGIIGYGTLGSRIGEVLSARNIGRVLVNDIDASKLVAMRGHTAKDTKTVSQNCDVIFCATGNFALKPEDYAQLKNNAVIFTVTSPDDELHLDQMIKNGVLVPVPEKKRGHTHVYRVTATGNEIVLPFNGESPNTILPYGIAGPIIHQTYAAHIAAAVSVMNKDKNGSVNGLQKLDPQLEQTVSQLWLEHFSQPDERLTSPKRRKVAPILPPRSNNAAIA